METFGNKMLVMVTVVSLMFLSGPVLGKVTCTGGGLTLVQEGGTFDTNNIASGKTAFAKDLIGNGAYRPTHDIPNLNNGTYGNSSSWIGNSTNSFCGISMGASPVYLTSIAIGRDNTGVYGDRTLGLYTLQYTTVANPTASTPDGSWTTIGTIYYQSDSGVYPFDYPSKRHRYNFNIVAATGIRLKVPDWACVDEIELYDYTAGRGLTLVEEGGTFAANNLASGKTAFAKDLIGNGSYIPTHAIPNLNNGTYGNSSSWIGNSEYSFCGISLGASPVSVCSIAFGRDNTAQAGDRSLGLMTLQYTTVANPSASTPDGSWTTIGTVDYGSGYAGYYYTIPNLRHRYNFTAVSATGFRLFVPGNGLTDGDCIDEIELYSTALQPARWVPSEFLVTLGWTTIGFAADINAYAQRLANMGLTTLMDGAYLDLAQSYGMNVDLYYAPTGPDIVNLYKNHAATWGYHQYDEPAYSTYSTVAYYHAAAHIADPTKPSCTNLQSINYGITRSNVQDFITMVHPEILSFDFYQWYWPTKTLTENLEYFRKKALQYDIPLYSWVEVDAKSDATTNAIRRRYSTYMNLVYGVKGIWWFTADRIFNVDPANPQTFGTIKDQTYYNDVQAINVQLNNLGPYLVGLKSTAVYHKNIGSGVKDWTGTDPMVPIPAHNWVQIYNSVPVSLGMFSGMPGYECIMITNRSVSTAQSTIVTFQNSVSSVQAFDAVNNSWSSLTIFGTYPNQYVSQTLDPGCGKLLRIVKN